MPQLSYWRGKSSNMAQAVLYGRDLGHGATGNQRSLLAWCLQKFKSQMWCVLVAPGDVCIDLFRNHA